MTDGRDPDKALLDDMTAHHVTMSILKVVSEAPSDGSAELAGVIMAAAVLARLCDGNRTMEYQRRKKFIKACADIFDKSLPFMRETEAAKAAAGFVQENPIISDAIAGDPDYNVLPTKEPPQEN